MTISILGYTAVEFPCEEVAGGEGLRAEIRAIDSQDVAEIL